MSSQSDANSAGPHPGPQQAASAEPVDDAALFDALTSARTRLTRSIGRRIVGQNDVVEQLLVALFARGHCLFVGVPGLAKTLMVETLARSVGGSFSRVQFLSLIHI